MKQIVLFLFLAFLFVNCNRQCGCIGDYTVNDNPCICIKFKGSIGDDFDSALDSLARQYKSKLIELETSGYYSGKGYFIERERINIDFTDDDRAFFYLGFMDSVITYRCLICNHDVLDDKGNYYVYINGLKD